LSNLSGPDLDPQAEADTFSKSIKHLSYEEFDGHTDFLLLSPEDKLNWLSEVARFFYDHHSNRVIYE
jgi:hypothetical protein